MTCYFHNRGPEYHWITDLYGRLNLPILPEIVRAFQKATQEQMKELEKKFDGTKQMRVSQKIARAEDQEEWKKWVKRQAILDLKCQDWLLDQLDTTLTSEDQEKCKGILMLSECYEALSQMLTNKSS